MNHLKTELQKVRCSNVSGFQMVNIQIPAVPHLIFTLKMSNEHSELSSPISDVIQPKNFVTQKFHQTSYRVTCKNEKNKTCYIFMFDLGHVIKLHPTSSTHQRRQSVRLQIPQLSVTVQRKEKKSSRKNK